MMQSTMHGYGGFAIVIDVFIILKLILEFQNLV